MGSLLKQDKRHDPAIVTAGVVRLFQGNDTQAAYDASRNALRRHKRYAPLWHIPGLSAARLGKTDEAITAGRKAVELGPALTAAHNNLCVALRQSGDFPGAAAALSEAAKLAPEVAEIHNNLVNCFKSAMRYSDSVIAYQRAIRVAPDLRGGDGEPRRRICRNERVGRC